MFWKCFSGYNTNILGLFRNMVVGIFKNIYKQYFENNILSICFRFNWKCSFYQLYFSPNFNLLHLPTFIIYPIPTPTLSNRAHIYTSSLNIFISNQPLHMHYMQVHPYVYCELVQNDLYFQFFINFLQGSKMSLHIYVNARETGLRSCGSS